LVSYKFYKIQVQMIETEPI